MTRVSALVLSVLIAAAPLGAANAQDRDPRAEIAVEKSGAAKTQDRDPRFGRDRDRPDQNREPPRRMSVAEAQSIAQSRAGGAEFKGYLGMRGSSHVFRFEQNGRVFDIAVDAN